MADQIPDAMMTVGVEVSPAELDRAVRQIMSLGQKVKPVSIPVSLVGGQGGDAQMALQNLFRKLEKDAKKALKIHFDLGGTAAEAGREASMSVKHVVDTLAKDPAWAGLRSHMDAIGVSAASHVIAGFERKLAASQLSAAVQRKAEYKSNLGVIHSQLRGGSAESKAVSRLGEAGQRAHEAAKLIGDPEATRRLAGEQIEILRKYGKEIEGIAKASGLSRSDAARQAQTSVYRVGKQYGVSMPGIQSAATEMAAKRDQADAARVESHRAQQASLEADRKRKAEQAKSAEYTKYRQEFSGEQAGNAAREKLEADRKRKAEQAKSAEYTKYRQEFSGEQAGNAAREKLEADRKRKEREALKPFSRSSIRGLAQEIKEQGLYGENRFEASDRAIDGLLAKAEAQFGLNTKKYKEVEHRLQRAFGKEVESRRLIGRASVDAMAQQALESVGSVAGTSVGAGQIRLALSAALKDRQSRREALENIIANGKASPQQKEDAFKARQDVFEFERRLQAVDRIEKEKEQIQKKIERNQGSRFFGGMRGNMLNRQMEQKNAEMQKLYGGGPMGGKTSAHGAQFAAMNAAYGFQDFFQVLAQPGMGVGRAVLAAANNVGPALAGLGAGAVGANVAIGALMAAMAGLQFVMQKNEDTLRKNKESADRLAESFKRVAVSAAQIGRSLPLGSQTGMGGAMEMQNAILGRAPMAGAMLNGIQSRSMESERARALSGMGFWGSTGRYWGDTFSRVGTDKSPSAVKQHLFGRIKSQDEIPSMVGGGRDFDVKFSEKTGQMVRRPTAERDKMVAEYEAAMLERQKQRKAMEESGDAALIEQEYLRNQEAMSQLGQMKKFSKGIGSRSRSGFQEALSDSRKFGDKGIATGYVQNLYGEMQQSAMAAKRAKQNLQFLEENEPAKAGRLRNQLSSLSSKQVALNKAGRGGEAEIVGQEIIDVKNQLMAFDNELKEARESVAVFSQVATETEAAFMSIASNYKKGIRDAGESGKTTMIQSSDLWSRIQDSLSGNDVEKQQLSVLEKILGAISGKEKLGSLKIGSLEGNDAGGYAGGGKKPSARDTILAKLREGEVVLTPEHQARLAQRLKMSPADLFGGMGMTHKGSSLSAWANVGGFDGGGLVGGMRFSSMLDGGFRKWQKQQDTQRNYANRQWGKWDDEEPFLDRYSQYRLQSGRMRMSAFYRNQGVPLYGRGAGGQGGRTLPSSSVPSFAEAWPGGMPYISPPGVSSGLPRTGRSAASFEEAMRQRAYRETMHQIRGVGASGHESSVGTANAMQLAEMQRRGMSQHSVDAMGRTHEGSAERAAEARRQQAAGAQRKVETEARKSVFQEERKKSDADREAAKRKAREESEAKAKSAKEAYKAAQDEAKKKVKSGEGFAKDESPEADDRRKASSNRMADALAAKRLGMTKDQYSEYQNRVGQGFNEEDAKSYATGSGPAYGKEKPKGEIPDRKQTLGERLLEEQEKRLKDQGLGSHSMGPSESIGERMLREQKERLNKSKAGLGDRMEEVFPGDKSDPQKRSPYESWKKGQKDDADLRKKGNELEFKSLLERVDAIPQNVSGRDQAASGVGFSGNDRNTAVLERIATILEGTDRNSIKHSEKVLDAIQSSGVSIQ